MAQGESRWNPKDRQVVTNEFPTAPTNDYVLKAKSGKWMVGCKDEAGAIPYVHGQVELLNTAKEEGGKNISMLLPMYLTLTPKKEDGKPAVDLAGGITDLCQKLHAEVPDTVTVKTFNATEDRGQTEALEAKAVKDFLNSLGEFVIKAHVKLNPAKGGWPAKNQVAYFIEDEGNAVG